MWCTNTQSGWDMWARQGYIFYRFMPKKNPYRKLRMSWSVNQLKESNWAFGYSYSSVHYYSRDEDPFTTKIAPQNDIQEEIVQHIEVIPDAAKDEIRKYHTEAAQSMQLVNVEAA